MDIEAGMELAIAAAERARAAGLRPFGSVIVDDSGGVVVGMAGGSETAINPTHHSEIAAIKRACWEKGGLLQGCTLFQTHEPCIGCSGFILHAKISRVVVGSMRSDLPLLFRQRNIGLHELLSDTTYPPELITVGGPLLERCVALFDDEVAQIQFRGPSAVRRVP